MGKQQCTGGSTETTRKLIISSEQRYVLAEWIYQICEHIYPDRHNSRVLFHLTVCILDLAIVTPQEFLGIPFGENTFQLLAICCIELAIQKLSQKGFLTYRPKSQSLLTFCGDKYTDREFYSYLNRIEQIKSFEGIVTVINSYEKYLAEGLNESTQVNTLSLVLMDSFILDHSTGKYLPSCVVFSAIAVARKLLMKKPDTEWSEQLSSISGFRFSNIEQCYKEMYHVAYLLFKEDKQPVKPTPPNPKSTDSHSPLGTLVQ